MPRAYSLHPQRPGHGANLPPEILWSIWRLRCGIRTSLITFSVPKSTILRPIQDVRLQLWRLSCVTTSGLRKEPVSSPAILPLHTATAFPQLPWGTSMTGRICSWNIALIIMMMPRLMLSLLSCVTAALCSSRTTVLTALPERGLIRTPQFILWL